MLSANMAERQWEYDGRMMKMSVIIAFLRPPPKLIPKIHFSHHIVRTKIKRLRSDHNDQAESCWLNMESVFQSRLY
jgi:hypothetical protein